MSIKRPFHAISTLGLICTLALTAWAQGTTSRVTGTVTDNVGAAVPGATVTLTNQTTNVVVGTATTNNSGVYLFDLVQSGSYKVAVEKSGFKRFESTNNTVLINQPATVNVTLEVGGISEVVSVEATAEQVQTATSGNVGTTIEQRTVESLPIVGLRGRNPLELLNFIPGTNTSEGAYFTGGGVHVHGSRDRAFNFTLDGIDINESTAGGSNFTPLRPNPDSLQELQVVTSGFTAELGRSSGAQVTLVTRSGTNDFRGSLFEYYVSKGLIANSYAANVIGSEKPNFVQHIFGGSFGGPLLNPGFGEGTKLGLLRDRAFFFVNMQFLRASDTALQNRTVYTQSVRDGIFRWVRNGVNGTAAVDANGTPLYPACPGPNPTDRCIDSYNIAQGTGIPLDTHLMSYINRMPLPNGFALAGDGLNYARYFFNSPQNEKQWDLHTKFDFKINDANHLYVRYSQGEQNTFGDSANSGRPRFPDADSYRVNTYRLPKNLAINWRSSPTAKFTNEFIFGKSDFEFSFENATVDPGHRHIFNIITDYSSAFAYNARSFRTLQFVDNMTYDLSPHVIKAGVNIRLGRSTDDRSSVAGTLTEGETFFSTSVNNNWDFPTPLPDPAQGQISTTDRNNLQSIINDVLGRVGLVRQAYVNDPNNPGQFADPGTRWLFEANHPELDFYAQDTWRWSRNFIVDLGLRWEMKLNPRPAGGRPILVPDQPFTLGAPATNSLRWTEGDLFDSSYFNLLPTLGFAWDPFNDGKTSIRLNYRKASDRISTFFYSSFIFQNAPGNTFLGSDTAYGTNGGLLRDGLPSTVPTTSPDNLRTPPAFSTGGITLIDPELKFPSIHNWTLSFQRELFAGNVFEFNYVGKKATNLLGGYDANAVNIHASLPGINAGTYLEEFQKIADNPAYSSPLINRLWAGNASNPAGTNRLRAIYGASTGSIPMGNAAGVALNISQRLCGTTERNAGLCTTPQIGQRLLAIHGVDSFFQPFSQYTGGLFVIDSNDFSFYNGLEFIMKRRLRSGISYNIGYTWAVSKDTRSYDPTFTAVATGSGQTAGNTPLDNYDRAANYSWSDFDRRHSLLGTYLVEMPFGSGKRFRANNSVLNYMISGWQLAGTVRITSGRPFTVYSGTNTVSNTRQSYASCDGCPRSMGEVHQGDYNAPGTGLRNWYFTDAERDRFYQPGAGDPGNTGRNYFIGPGYFQTDVSLSRKFKFTETLSFDIRVDARNLTNSVSFDMPSTVLPFAYRVDGFTSSLFGRINADVTTAPRRVQLSGRLNF